MNSEKLFPIIKSIYNIEVLNYLIRRKEFKLFKRKDRRVIYK